MKTHLKIVSYFDYILLYFCGFKEVIFRAEIKPISCHTEVLGLPRSRHIQLN